MHTPSLSADDRALSLDGVCEITTCSRPYIYRLVAEGRFPKPKKIGRKNIWMRSTVLDWLRDQRPGVNRGSEEEASAAFHASSTDGKGGDHV